MEEQCEKHFFTTANLPALGKRPGQVGHVLCVLTNFPHLSLGHWFPEGPERNINITYFLGLSSVEGRSRSSQGKDIVLSFVREQHSVIPMSVWESQPLLMLPICKSRFHFRKATVFPFRYTAISEAHLPHPWSLIFPSLLVITPFSHWPFLNIIAYTQVYCYLNRQFTKLDFKPS